MHRKFAALDSIKLSSFDQFLKLAWLVIVVGRRGRYGAARNELRNP